METGAAVIMWTTLLLTTTSELKGESTASSPALTPGLTPNEVISVALHVTPGNNVMEPQPDSTHMSVFPPHNETSRTAAFSPPSEPSPHTAVMAVSSPPPASTQAPAPGRSTETAQASSDTSPALTSLRSTTITPGSMMTLTASTAAFTSLGEEHQTSHQSTISASETIPMDSSVPSSSPASTWTALLDKTQPTGPVPVENPHQDGPSELDVGDEDSDSAKVPHASPWDPLLAALVSIFVVSTALVSVMLFLRFRQQSEHPEFHRLQDLPMDDLLEDTPLSSYSY
ncbi:hypothetical protein SRHO_G00017410 [Serrasalmus rhombeus]